MTDHDDFFREKRATAALKHGILRLYAPVFASKAGSTTRGRVVFLDGYAGPGQYRDDSPGSPLLLARSADFVQGFRDVTCYFVEQDGGHFADLKRMLDERGDARLRPLHGDLNDHLATILAKAHGAALLAFLDPFGTALDRDRVVTDLLRRGAAPTELLLHFSLSTVARTGGIVRKITREGRVPSAKEAATLANLDRFLGGGWWRQHFNSIEADDDLTTATLVAGRVADDFRRHIGQRTGFSSVSMPVLMRPDRAPKYLMVLFTRHPEGVWQFADALGKAGLDWNAAWRKDVSSQVRKRELAQHAIPLFGELPDLEFDPREYERRNLNVWVAEIKRNIVDLLANRNGARLRDHTIEVYGATLGSAWVRHIRAAVKELHSAEILDNDGKHDFERRPTMLLKRPG